MFSAAFASGDLTLSITVCGGRNFDVLGLSACDFDTTYDAETRTSFTLTYTVTDSKGSSSSVERTVKLIPVCDPGEELCPDDKCSKGGLCEGAAPAVPSEPNKKPAISLKTHEAVGASVNIRRGDRYVVCSKTVEPSTDKPCELGATAIDPEDGDISSKVGRSMGRISDPVCMPGSFHLATFM